MLNPDGMCRTYARTRFCFFFFVRRQVSVTVGVPYWGVMKLVRSNLFCVRQNVTFVKRFHSTSLYSHQKDEYTARFTCHSPTLTFFFFSFVLLEQFQEHRNHSLLRTKLCQRLNPLFYNVLETIKNFFRLLLKLPILCNRNFVIASYQKFYDVFITVLALKLHSAYQNN